MKRPGIPDDIYRVLRQWCSVRRAAHITRGQVRRRRAMISDASGRCVKTPAALNCVPVSPVGSILAAPPQGQSRLAPVTGQ